MKMLTKHQTEAYYDMICALIGIRVVEKRSNRIIPRYILFERIGQQRNHEFNMVVEMCHPGYYFIGVKTLKEGEFKSLLTS